MKYFKQLDDKTWVSFDEGEDMEWEELLDGLKLGFFYICPVNIRLLPHLLAI